MGLPIYQETRSSANPSATASDPTARARSSIRRHHRDENTDRRRTFYEEMSQRFPQEALYRSDVDRTHPSLRRDHEASRARFASTPMSGSNATLREIFRQHAGIEGSDSSLNDALAAANELALTRAYASARRANLRNLTARQRYESASVVDWPQSPNQTSANESSRRPTSRYGPSIARDGQTLPGLANRGERDRLRHTPLPPLSNVREHHISRDSHRHSGIRIARMPRRREEQHSLTRLPGSSSAPAPEFSGLGDRERSWSPESDDPWETLLTTITPDPSFPSAGSSFASNAATANAPMASSEYADTSAPVTEAQTTAAANEPTAPRYPSRGAAISPLPTPPHDTAECDEDGLETRATIMYDGEHGPQESGTADSHTGRANADSVYTSAAQVCLQIRDFSRMINIVSHQYRLFSEDLSAGGSLDLAQEELNEIDRMLQRMRRWPASDLAEAGISRSADGLPVSTSMFERHLSRDMRPGGLLSEAANHLRAGEDSFDRVRNILPRFEHLGQAQSEHDIHRGRFHGPPPPGDSWLMNAELGSSHGHNRRPAPPPPAGDEFLSQMQAQHQSQYHGPPPPRDDF